MERIDQRNQKRHKSVAIRSPEEDSIRTYEVDDDEFDAPGYGSDDSDNDNGLDISSDMVDNPQSVASSDSKSDSVNQSESPETAPQVAASAQNSKPDKITSRSKQTSKVSQNDDEQWSFLDPHETFSNIKPFKKGKLLLFKGR
jgi:hypothetical protein